MNVPQFLIAIEVSHALTAVLCCVAHCAPVPSGTCPVLKANENLQLDVLPARLSRSLNASKGPRSEYQVPLPLKEEAEVISLL